MSQPMTKADAAVFAPNQQRDRHEKGSAMSLIAADAKATEAKSARLKALRLEREAAELAAAPEPAPKKPAAKRQRKAA